MIIRKFFAASLTLLGTLGPLSEVRAEYFQSLGQSSRQIALGGAFSAVADDVSVFYSNPAGAASFDGLIIGGGLNVIDTTNVDLRDSGGNHDVEDTIADSQFGYAPTFALYGPVTERLVAGIGFGVSNAITGDWENDDGIHRYSFSEQTLLTADLVPTLALKLTDRLQIGAALNITVFKYLRTESLFPATFGDALLAGVVAAPTPTSSVIGSLEVESPDDFPLPVPPFDFDTGFDEFGATFGLLFALNPRTRLALVYRLGQDIDYEGDATLAFPPLGLRQEVQFETTIGSPAHLQIGVAHEILLAKLRGSLDLQWTRWSDAEGLGTPLTVRLNRPFVAPVNVGGALVNTNINGAEIDYRADDTLAVRAGLEYRLSPTWSLLGGFAWDPSPIDDADIDILLYSIDRRILSAGFQWTSRTDGKGWQLAGHFQAILAAERTIEAGESRNLGGFALPNLTAGGNLAQVPNAERFEYGGEIYSFGATVSYRY